MLIIIIIIWFGDTVTVSHPTKCNTYSKVHALSYVVKNTLQPNYISCSFRIGVSLMIKKFKNFQHSFDFCCSELWGQFRSNHEQQRILRSGSDCTPSILSRESDFCYNAGRSGLPSSCFDALQVFELDGHLSFHRRTCLPSHMVSSK